MEYLNLLVYAAAAFGVWKIISPFFSKPDKTPEKEHQASTAAGTGAGLTTAANQVVENSKPLETLVAAGTEAHQVQSGVVAAQEKKVEEIENTPSTSKPIQTPAQGVAWVDSVTGGNKEES